MEHITGYKCKDCGAGPFLMPTMACQKCHSQNLEEVALSGNGKIHTFTIVHAAFGSLKEKAPYALCIVELQEGPRLLTIVEDVNVETLKVEHPVRLKYFNEEKIPIFQGA